MKLPGYCEKCHKIKNGVQVNMSRFAAMGGQTPVGICDQCAEIERGFTCPRCRRTSHNPDDVREGYCGHCHDWTGRSRVPVGLRRRRP